jgi:signal transduction histidine kinase
MDAQPFLPERLNRYRELQAYVGWTDDDASRILRAGPFVRDRLLPLIDDFYEEIERHPQASKVITGGQAQVDRLKGTLIRWVQELFAGQYDAAYVDRRWKVGNRHVEIGLDQVYTNVALSRLRSGLVQLLESQWNGSAEELHATIRSLHKLLDLDLAIIEDAYQLEHLERHQRAERLITIGQVAGGVAHEVRNPLNVIKTSVYYLLNARNASQEKVREHLSRIQSQVAHADGVISALSNFARLPLPNLQPFDLSAALWETIETCGLPPMIELSVDCSEDLPSALGDQTQLQIVFSNLIRNARDAMPGGGRLQIFARGEPGWIELRIEDNGIGIPRENLSRITEPLFTTKARGIGLGLAMAKAIVEKHQGSLSAESELGRGSTFTVRFPAAPATAFEPTATVA